MTAKRSQKESTKDVSGGALEYEADLFEDAPVEASPARVEHPPKASAPRGVGGRYRMENGVRVLVDPGTQGG